jgi:hypothetical protein
MPCVGDRRICRVIQVVGAQRHFTSRAKSRIDGIGAGETMEEIVEPAILE